MTVTYILACFVAVSLNSVVHGRKYTQQIDMFHAKKFRASVHMYSLTRNSGRKTLEIEWVPMNCKLITDNPNACDDLTCSITFNLEGMGFWDAFYIQPFWKQKNSNACQKLTEGLQEGYNNLTKLKGKNPVEGCPIIKLPEVKTKEQWDRCMKQPLQPLPSDKYKDGYNEFRFKTHLRDNSTVTEVNFIRLPGNDHNKTAFGDSFPVEKIVDIDDQKDNCSRHVTVKNRLPVPIVVQITKYGPDDSKKLHNLEPFGSLSYDASRTDSTFVVVKKVEGVYHTYAGYPLLRDPTWYQEWKRQENCTVNTEDS